VETGTGVQAPDTRASSGAGCEGSVAGRLYEQPGLRIRLLRAIISRPNFSRRSSIGEGCFSLLLCDGHVQQARA